MKSRAVIALLLAAAALPASANTLYKSVDSNGVVMFSDVPPPSGARIVEERELGAPPAAAAMYAQPMPGSPTIAAPGGAAANLEQLYTLIDADEALAKANARVDQAERGLAQARKTVASRFEGLRLASTHAERANRERISFYENDLKLARRDLCELLKARQSARPEPGSAYVVAVQPITARVAAARLASR
jgi:hypothetical protein